MRTSVTAEEPARAGLVLASGSPYRKALLARLGVPFVTSATHVDENARPGETAASLVCRLARDKAARAARDHPEAAAIIGSDQVAVRDGEILGKPGTHEAAVRQLTAASGRAVRFLTGVGVLTRDGTWRNHTDVTTVHFRTLPEERIEQYLRRERPYDCAGGFKVEALGIALFTRIESEDPTALIGLPLIWLARALEEAGIPVI